MENHNQVGRTLYRNIDRKVRVQKRRLLQMLWSPAVSADPGGWRLAANGGVGWAVNPTVLTIVILDVHGCTSFCSKRASYLLDPPSGPDDMISN